MALFKSLLFHGLHLVRNYQWCIVKIYFYIVKTDVGHLLNHSLFVLGTFLETEMCLNSFICLQWVLFSPV